MEISVRSLKFEKIRNLRLRYIFLIFLCFSAIFINKALFFLVIISLLDFSASFFKKSFKLEPPFDFVVIGTIIFCYFRFSLFYLIYFPLLMLLNRIIYARVQSRHFIKVLIVVATGIFTQFLSDFDLLIVFPLAYGFRLVSDYLINFLLFSQIDLKRIPNRILQIIIFYLLSVSLRDLLLFFLK
ncbi:hypothetical protein GF327_05845 [Candidatus Woesearchaeota archaeon]|nr:hypothetical protein [Candidatus Woesearchaeota archaeon]